MANISLPIFDLLCVLTITSILEISWLHICCKEPSIFYLPALTPRGQKFIWSIEAACFFNNWWNKIMLKKAVLILLETREKNEMKLKLNRRNFPVSGSCTKSSSPGYNLMVITDTFKHTRKMHQCLSDLSSHNMLHRSDTTATSASSSFREEQFWQSWASWAAGSASPFEAPFSWENFPLLR